MNEIRTKSTSNYRQPALFAQIIGGLIVLILLSGLVVNLLGILRRQLDRRSVVLVSESTLSKSMNYATGLTKTSDHSDTPVLAVIVQNISSFFAASHVTITQFTNAFSNRHLDSKYIPLIYPNQTIAIILPVVAIQASHHIHITVKQWKTTTIDNPTVPQVKWQSRTNDFMVRLSTFRGQTYLPIMLVGVFFTRSGMIAAVGIQYLPPLPPGTTKLVNLPISYGNVPIGAKTALFEEPW